MRTGRSFLAGALIAATALTTATATAPPVVAAVAMSPALGSAAPGAPVFTAASVSPDRVAVRGLDLAPVTVTLTFADTHYGDPDDVLLFRTISSSHWDRSEPQSLIAPLTRTSGSGSSGTFSATVRVPSSADGGWRVMEAQWSDGGGLVRADLSQSGIPEPTFAVTGTHRPRMRLLLSPEPIPYPQTRATARAVVTFDDTGAPIPGFEVAFGADGCAGWPPLPAVVVRTDRHGVATRPIRVHGVDSVCAWGPLPGASALESFPGWTTVPRFVTLGTVTSASPSRSSIRQRRSVAVNGRITALVVPSGRMVALQRRAGRHWRTVNTGKIRPSGRFSVAASPPLGRNLYRVQFQGGYGFGSSASRIFAVTGT